jgi:pyruvate,water dikinase
MAEAEGPVARMHDRVRAHATARRAALDGRPGLARVRLRVVLRLARRYTELREVGKALMLQCLDVGRAGARALGTALVARGVLERAEDVFFLTTDEARVATADGVDRRALVGDRRDQHERYRSITLPLSFDGSELAAIVDAQLDGDDASTASRAVVEGLGVSQGTATGIARVVLDPLECRDFVPGEILVCSTTDPGWAPVLSLAGGVVLDMGSMLSHGAIVARELGVPCVANTTDGTRRIPDGALVHLDGTTGVVDVIDPGPAPATGDAA